MNENSMLYWFKRIENLGIPTPHTIFCGINDTNAITEAAEKLGYPCFLRTDLASGKHDWKDSCFVETKQQIPEHMNKIMEANVRWQMLGIEPQAFVVREFLPLYTLFTAFEGNMPINKERRYFVKDGIIQCSHPYWPITAFNNHPARMANDPDYCHKLDLLNQSDKSEQGLTDYATKVGKELGDYWSIDFAQDVKGKWWLLDMALGNNSYHYPHNV